MSQAINQVRVITDASAVDGQAYTPTAFFDEDGNPVDVGGGSSGPSAWDDVTGKPSTFPPATHTHTVANVTGLQAALDAKATTAALTALTARVAALEAAE